MNNITKHRTVGLQDRRLDQRIGKKIDVAAHLLTGVVLACAMHTGSVQAAGAVTVIETADQPATPSRFSIDGITYTWGFGQNQVMEGFSADGQTFDYANAADRVEIVRHDVNNVSTGNPCGVFVERVGASSEVLSANYPSDGTDTGNCDMAAMLASRVVNRGALDLFSNTGPNPKNVERVDYIFDRGVLAPLSDTALPLSGHVVAEKSGNNPLQIAAITAVDILGNPTAYGPLVLVERNGCSGDTVCYGVTNLRHNYTFFQNNSLVPQGFPSFLKDSTESVGMAFVSLERMGLNAGQLYYGFSYFPDDVDASEHTLTDVSTFPQDTNDEQILFGDGPDIYGGVSGYYLGETLSVASGAVFKDENGDGELGLDEAGISDIRLSLFVDSNGNGVLDADSDAQLGPDFNTDINGEFRIPGLENGIYFLSLDEADEDLPPAISVAPGSNPAMFVIQGNDADGINFSFVSDTGPSDRNNTDSDAGATDAGADAGATDSGSDAGATDSGADAGTTDSGADAGAGTTDSGADAGATDSGADAGATDSGTDAGTTDSGSDSGATDSGATDANSDGGSIDAGGTDSGATDAGSTTGGADEGFDVINDGTTVANRDTATVNQGSSVLIEVLANDLDASGLGLTVTNSPESANASIEVDENGVISYSPNTEFFGMDSFLYVIEDGNGLESTGTVAVDVLRFSDINDNGLNDFDECNCDNLTIEVGVDGSALGATSFISFSMLMFLFSFRGIAPSGRSKSCGVDE